MNLPSPVSFLVLFFVFGNVVKHGLSCLIYYLTHVSHCFALEKLLTLWSCFTGEYNPVGPKDSQSLTLCLNSTKIVETLEDVTAKARAMYDAGAYLHWFWKHGCSEVTVFTHMF